MSWLFGPREIKLTLMKYEGTRIVGFADNGPITCIVNRGDTIGSVLDRYNTYRGPGKEFKESWDISGNKLPLSTGIYKDMVLIVGGV